MKKLLLLAFSFILFQSSIPAQTHVKHILLEEFSTAQCGFCPDGDVIAAQLIRDHPSVIWLTHHAGFGTDSLTVPESVPIANAFTTFAPGACIDRGDYPIPIYTMPPYIAVSRQRWDSVCVAHLGDDPMLDIRITNSYSSATRTLDCAVEASFTGTPVPGDLRLNVYIVEDSAVGFGKGYNQLNYFNGTPGHPYYRKGDTIVGYRHERVLRAVPSSAWGLSGIIPAAPAAGQTFSTELKGIPISSRWNEKALDVVAFVSYYSSDAKKRSVLNANSERLHGGASGTADGDPPNTGSYTLYPNPSQGTVFLAARDGTDARATVSMYDSYGRMVRHRDVRTAMPIALDGLPAGVYFFKIQGMNGILQTGKFLLTQ